MCTTVPKPPVATQTPPAPTARSIAGAPMPIVLTTRRVAGSMRVTVKSLASPTHDSTLAAGNRRGLRADVDGRQHAIRLRVDDDHGRRGDLHGCRSRIARQGEYDHARRSRRPARRRRAPEPPRLRRRTAGRLPLARVARVERSAWHRQPAPRARDPGPGWRARAAGAPAPARARARSASSRRPSR